MIFNMVYHVAVDEMIAMEYTFHDNRKVVLCDVFTKVHQLNPLAIGNRFITEQIKDSKNKYPVILTVKNVKNDYVFPKEIKGGSIHILNCYKLLED